MSCLFNSLSYHTKNYTSPQLRTMICDYLQTDPILIEDKNFSSLLGSKQKLNSYVKNMRSPHTWGGAYEIRAFCEIFQVIVYVRTSSHRRDIEFRPHELNIDHPKIVRIDWNGFHYEPLRTRTGHGIRG